MSRIKVLIRYRIKKIRISCVKFGRALKRESKETVVAAKILKKLIKDEGSVTEEEVKFLKSQGADLGKAVGLLGLQLVPGSSVGIIVLEKIGKKKGFTVFPKKNELPTSSESSSSAPQ